MISKALENELMEMVADGLIEFAHGEDGQRQWFLTDKGRATAEQMGRNTYEDLYGPMRFED